MKKAFLIGALLVGACIQSAMAIPARRDVIKTFAQPDGTTVSVRVIGDEHSHCYVTLDNRPLLCDTQGRLCYATLDAAGQPVASSIMASDIESRSAAELSLIASFDSETIGNKILSRSSERRQSKAALRANQSTGKGLYGELFPHTGDVHALVILVQYKDVKFSVPDAGDYYNRFLNQEGFSDDGATGSARDYFIASSDGQFRPTFDAYGPVTLANDRKYYGGNDYWGNDLRAEEMVKEACEKLDDQINFADYDLDNDGLVDNIYVIYAGQGENSYGPAESIWPHQYDVRSANITCTLDGKTLATYGCCNEWNDTNPDGIGVFCHEFGHVMGLPDLYDTDYKNAIYLTPSDWSIMDYGSYLNDARTPPSYSVFERNAMGWIDPVVLTPESTISLENIHDSNTGAIALTDDENEFFLFENRQQTGWDTYLPGHGMIVWHILYDTTVWRNNEPNNSASKQYIDIEEACGTANSNSLSVLAGYPFPGTKNVTEFTDETTPNMLTWNKKSLGLPITGITEHNGVITFDVAGGFVELATPAPAVSDITPAGFTVSWPEVDKAYSYSIALTEGADRTPVAGLEDITTTETSYTFDRLTYDATYYVSVKAFHGSFESDYSDEIAVTTAPRSFEYDMPGILPAENVGATSFTARWEPVEDAAEYLLTVSHLYPVGGNQYTCDFGSGSSLTLPEGWTSSSTDSYGSSYSGVEAPAAKLAQNGYNITTCVYPIDIVAFKYWARGANASETNYLELQVNDGEDDEEWTTVHTLQPLENKAGGNTVECTDIPAGTRRVRLVYFKKQSGNVAIDDIVVTLGGFEQGVLDGYDSLNVGNVTSYTLSGLPESEDYFYMVQARRADGTLSRLSDTISVNTGKTTTGIADAEIPVQTEEAQVFSLQGVRITGTPAPGIYIRRCGSSVEKIVVK